MIGTYSKSAGILILPKGKANECMALNVANGEVEDLDKIRYIYSVIQDWEDVKSENKSSMLENVSCEYWLSRTVSILRAAIGGLEKALGIRALEHVEGLLSSRVSSNEVICRLLIAPLNNQRSAIALAESALGQGLSATGDILDQVVELQPLLNRLTYQWLSVPEMCLNDTTFSKQTIWVMAVEKCMIKELILAKSRREFVDRWNLLAFNFSLPQVRSEVQTLGHDLSGRLFPQESLEAHTLYTEQDEYCTINALNESFSRREKSQDVYSYETFKRVKKQIEAIAQAVSEGRDANANKFLKELIVRQTSFADEPNYAIKSLCNIAKRCADMFRMDFEYICLKTALDLDQFDAWTLIQYGDHLKRTGNYDEALNVFYKAEQSGAGLIVKECVANVFSQQGYYERAIRIYEDTPSFKREPDALTGIANNLRKMGRLEDAKEKYDLIIKLADEGVEGFSDYIIRAQVGLAEIEKRSGRLEVAQQMYREIIPQEGIKARDLIFYKLGFCNVLKHMEKYDEAYEVADELIQDYPFSMEARFIRGSILGLSGRELEGLKDLPDGVNFHSWREWLRPYYRGLLLLKLKRYKEARKNLVDELPNAIASGEDKIIFRLVAALAFISGEDYNEFDEVLADIPNNHNMQTSYLALVLKLHAATLKEDTKMMMYLEQQIECVEVKEESLQKAVVAISERNFNLAIRYEADAFLKRAA